MAYKKPLRMYYIDTLTYNELIATHKTITVDKFGEYIYGFGPQHNICKNTTVMVEMNPLNGRQSCIATVNMVNVIYKLNNRKTFLIDDKPYKQYRFVCDDDAVADGNNTITGIYAYNYLMKVILKHYTIEDINKIFDEHSRAKDPQLIQWHKLTAPAKPYHKYHFENAYYFDINAAHTDALMELFPKCKKDFNKMYEKRHENGGKFKKIFNFFVGYLCRVGRRETYNWIVQRTTRKLLKFKDELCDDCLSEENVIYANTDGIFIMNPKITPESSKMMGEFKLEYHGPVDTYRGRNYTIIQYGDKIKGSCPLSMRKDIDLRKNKAVDFVTNHYKKNGVIVTEYSNVKVVDIDA